MYWRWIISIILGLCWLLVVCANAQWLWIKFKNRDKDKEDNTSPVALAGALFAIGALAVCPWNNSRKWYLLVPALILDAGSGLLIVLGLAAFLVESLGSFQSRVARASWIIKLGGSFLVWFILVGGTLSEAGWRQDALGVVVISYWPILLAWFWRLRKIHSEGKKP
jgi:hypothetical protein